MAMAAAAIDRLIDSSSDPGMDKDPNSHRPRPLYRYHSYTPASTQPRSPSPSSFSPSPYVVNFKGRRAPPPPLDKGSASKFRDPGPSEQQQQQQQQGKSSSWKPVALEKSFESQDGSFKQRKNGCYQDDLVAKSLNDKHSLVASEGKGKLAGDEHSTQPYSRNLSQSSSGYGEEFFDAPESPFGGSVCDETSSQSECNLLEDAELQAAEEIGRGEDDAARCRKAEEALEIVLQKLAAGGLALPPTLLERGKSPAEEVRGQVEDLDIAGQLLIKRMVEAAVARGAARAEVEENLEAELESKSREVIRLRDKVRYNELVNREMSQRNQEAIEMARNKRRARQRKIRWAVASASAAFAIGLSGALLYKYGPWHEIQLWKTKPEASGKDSP